MFNQKTLQQHPNLTSILQKLSGKVSSEDIQKLNYLVDHDRKSVNEVVKDFLSKKDLR